jgi:tripartite motif-containing protein 71
MPQEQEIMSPHDTRVTLPRTMSILFVVALLPGLGTAEPPSIPAGRDEGPGRIGFLRAWGERGADPGQFDFPIGIAVNAADELFITDHYNNRVQKFDTSGKLLAHFAVLPNPGGIAIDNTGNIYLTHFRVSLRSKDATGNRVSVYSPEGKLLRQWGKTGTGHGEFDCPGGIVVAKDGRVFVADQTNHRIQVFDRAGKFLLEWGEYGNKAGQFGGKSTRNSRVGGPQFVALGPAGNVWTTEGANCRIQQFTPKGKHLRAWGTSEDKPGGFGGPFNGFGPGKAGSIRGPIALCFDRHGRLWVSAVCGRVQQFTPEGKYLRGLVDEQGTKPGQFYAPHGVAFDSKGCLYVVDAFNHRIQKFKVER